MLTDLFGRPVRFIGGRTIIADETYIREKILHPRAQPIEGYLDSVMPTFEGQLNEEQLLALIAYIKAIGPAPGTQQPTSSGTSPQSLGQQPGIAGPGATSISGSKPGDR